MFYFTSSSFSSFDPKYHSSSSSKVGRRRVEREDREVPAGAGHDVLGGGAVVEGEVRLKSKGGSRMLDRRIAPPLFFGHHDLVRAAPAVVAAAATSASAVGAAAIRAGCPC